MLAGSGHIAARCRLASPAQAFVRTVAVTAGDAAPMLDTVGGDPVKVLRLGTLEPPQSVRTASTQCDLDFRNVPGRCYGSRSLMGLRSIFLLANER